MASAAAFVAVGTTPTLAGGVAGQSFAATNPFTAAVVLIAAAYIDSAFFVPAISGSGKQASRVPSTFGVPVGSNEAGAPRIWAIGTRVRVPTHILWQDEKTRQATTTNTKAGTSVTQRQVLIDALISLNDRKTSEVLQLIGNGALMVFTTRNLRRVTTSSMSAAVSGATVVLTVDSTADPSFSDVFEIGDFVKLYGWLPATSTPAVNGYYWLVTAVTDHVSSTPSTLTLQPVDGQTIAAVSATAGSAASPGWVERVDDAIVYDPATIFASEAGNLVGIFDPSARNASEVFSMGDVVRFRNFASTYSLASTVSGLPPAGGILIQKQNGNSILPIVGGTSWPRIEFFTPQNAASGIFPVGYDPLDHYFDGSEDQGEAPLLAASKGTGTIPAYRGVAAIEFDDFNASRFGDSLPFSLEAIIAPDSAMTWAEAVREVMIRAGIDRGAIDVSGVPSKPFAGYFVRGAPPPLTALQPLIIAGQLLGQERDGTIAIFTADNADVVQVQNGATYSAFGSRIYGEQRVDEPTVEDVAEEDLPTSVAIRHQDPDNVYAPGYQVFGRRNPLGPEFENRQEVDVSTLVLTRKEAKNLATTLLRRAHVNRRTYTMTLDARYGHLLENDILTWTDADSGEDIEARIVQRDEGQNFLVKITAIAEDVDLPVYGSPVQTGSGTTNGSLPAPAVLRPVVLDIPALTNADAMSPGVYLGVCAEDGSAWAGAVVYETVDGTNWHLLPSVLGDQTAIGVADSDLAAATQAESYGTTTVTNSGTGVDVLFPGSPQLDDASLAQVDAGENWIAMIDSSGNVEIAAFTTATPITGGFTLGGLYRGLRGTTPIDIVSGNRIVVLSSNATQSSGLAFRNVPNAPASLGYRFVPPGLSFDDVADSQVNIVATASNARPFPVRSISKTIGASPYDARFTVDAHWDRQQAPLGTQPPHALDEPVEGYRLTVYDPTGTIVKRTRNIQASPTGGSPELRDKWFDYTAAQQTADGYTPSSSETFVIDIQQIGQFGLGPSIKQEL